MAIRIFPSSFHDETVAIQTFMRGLLESARLRHPNLARLYRGGVTRTKKGPTWFLATEYLRGGSLRERLKPAGPLDLQLSCRQICRQAAAGLGELHRHGMVHRNVSPACILFDGDGVAKIGEFRYVRQQQLIDGAEKSAMVSRGDAAYQAPEQVMGTEALTAGCDQYALAATLYDALTGRPIFDPLLSPPELREAIAQQRIGLPAPLTPRGLGQRGRRAGSRGSPSVRRIATQRSRRSFGCSLRWAHMRSGWVRICRRLNHGSTPQTTNSRSRFAAGPKLKNGQSISSQFGVQRANSSSPAVR